MFAIYPRVENLEKFKSDEGDCPTLVCTDLAARGLDLDVDHVIMFDFPLNSVSHLFPIGCLPFLPLCIFSLLSRNLSYISSMNANTYKRNSIFGVGNFYEC